MAVSVIDIFETGEYDTQVKRAADVLRGGGLVVLPTETVYGAAGLLSQPGAVERLRSMRGEPASGANESSSNDKPFTVHLARANDAFQYIADVSDLGRRMIRKLWPGPVALTFDVSKDRQREASAMLRVNPRDLYASDDTITLRCPDHIVATDVIGAASGASGGPVALSAVEVAGSSSGDGKLSFDHLEGRIDLAFDAGPSRYAKPSTIVKVGRNSWEIARVGIYDARIIERLLRTTVLFVCSGNTCRSPMAEALGRKIIADQLHVSEDQLEAKGISVLSAGSFAMPGTRAAVPAIEALKPMGVDLSKHRSRPLSVELVHQADVIFTMSRSHTSAVLSLVPGAADKTMTLDPSGDIEDPIGGDVSLYKELATSLMPIIEKRLKETVLKPN